MLLAFYIFKIRIIDCFNVIMRITFNEYLHFVIGVGYKMCMCYKFVTVKLLIKFKLNIWSLLYIKSIYLFYKIKLNFTLTFSLNW